MKRTLLTCFLSLCIAAIAISQTTFSSKMTVPDAPEKNPFIITSGDLNNDTNIDILIGTSDLDLDAGILDTIEWYKNDGSGIFALQIFVSTTLKQIGGLQIVDLNGDGWNDIVATSYFQNKLVWFENDKDGGFKVESVISSSVGGAGAIVTGFIDSGTTVDIAIVCGISNEVVWFSNSGSGVFSSANTIATAIGPGDLDLADFDNDGDLDVVIMTASIIKLYINNLDPPTNNNPIVFTEDTNSVSTTGSYFFDVSFADVDDNNNNDNYLDILVSDLNGGDVAWYNKEMDGSFTKNIFSSEINRPATLIAADLNNDNYTDIIISFGSTSPTIPDIAWFESTGPGTYFTEASIDATQTQVYSFTIADFDNDGDKDIASIPFQDSGIFEYELNWFSNDFIILGLNDNSFNKISIYPNPTSDKLYFKSTLNENFKVSVFDILGKKIIEKTLNTNQALDVSRLHTGIYIIRFDGYNTTFKFVKK